MKKFSFLVLPIIVLGLLHLGMGRGGDAQYDLDAREQEKIDKEQEKAENAGKSFSEKLKEAAKGDDEKTVEIVPPKAKSDDSAQIKFKIPGT